MKTTQMAINCWTDKQNIWYTHTTEYSSATKEWSTDTHYSMDEPQECYAKWKKWYTKKHILYYSIQMKCVE